MFTEKVYKKSRFEYCYRSQKNQYTHARKQKHKTENKSFPLYSTDIPYKKHMFALYYYRTYNILNIHINVSGYGDPG